MAQPRLLKVFRLTHLYFGVFICPALLFFAFSGALQTFGLHETSRDRPNYRPAHWIQVLSQIHKKQSATVPVRRPQPAPGPASAAVPGTPAALSSSSATQLQPAPHRHDDNAGPSARPAQLAPPVPAAAPEARRVNPLPLRIFFLIVCLGLFTSTLTGLYMSYVFERNNRTWVTLTLLAGIILPLLLLLF